MVMEVERVKLSNSSQPTCTSTSGEEHHMYMYITCPDAGTPLRCLNIVINCICVCVLLSVIVHVFVQMCM